MSIFDVRQGDTIKIPFTLVDFSGNKVSGQAVNVTKELFDEDGVAAEVLSVAESGTTGKYNASFTPTKSAVKGLNYLLRLRGPTPATDGSVIEHTVTSFPVIVFSGVAGPQLTTLSNLKAYLSEVGTANDALLSRLIQVASDAIERYCNRKFASATYVQLFDGTGTGVLVLRQKPLGSSAAITVLEGGSAITVGDDPSADPAPDLLSYAESGMLVRPFGTFIRLRRFYKVTYPAGFATIPAPVEQAAIDLASLYFREKDRVGLNTKNIGQQSVNYTRGLPDWIRIPLDTYRLWPMGIAA